MKRNIQNRTYITIRILKHNNKNTQFTKLNISIQNIQSYITKHTTIYIKIYNHIQQNIQPYIAKYTTIYSNTYNHI